MLTAVLSRWSGMKLIVAWIYATYISPDTIALLRQLASNRHASVSLVSLESSPTVHVKLLCLFLDLFQKMHYDLSDALGSAAHAECVQIVLQVKF